MAEDRTLPGSNPSAATTQGQGRGCLWPNAKNPGVWGRSPQRSQPEVATGGLAIVTTDLVALGLLMRLIPVGRYFGGSNGTAGAGGA